jgi:2-haloacid dehalogenase
VAPLPADAPVVFDAYGTLLDVHTATARVLGPAGAALSASWRAKQLELTWVLSHAGAWEDFREVTARALDWALAVHGEEARPLRDALLEAYDRLDPQPDAVAALGRLREQGRTLAILSNGTPEMLARGVAAAGLAPLLDAVWSVSDLRRYKPHPSVYALASDRLGRPPAEVVFVSANAWDAWGAARFGLAAVWLNRARGPLEYGLDRLARAVLPGLEPLPAALSG